MKKNIIKCPLCGYQYLPAEIFYPDTFFGNPGRIIKDDNGEILHFDGSDMQLFETYICDHCGKEFKVEASVAFKSDVVENMFDSADIFSDVE